MSVWYDKRPLHEFHITAVRHFATWRRNCQAGQPPMGAPYLTYFMRSRGVNPGCLGVATPRFWAGGHGESQRVVDGS